MNKKTFDMLFSTEEQCQKYIFRIKWGRRFKCPYCGGRKCWVEGTKYKCKECSRKTSLKVGTIFQDSPIPLVVWFRCLWQAAVASQKGKITTGIFRAELGDCSNHTSLAVLKRIQRAIDKTESKKLQGTVEVYSTLVRLIDGDKTLIVVSEIQNKKNGCIQIGLIDKHSNIQKIEFVERCAEVGTTILYDDYINEFSRLKAKGYNFGNQPTSVEKTKSLATFLASRLHGKFNTKMAMQELERYANKNNQNKKSVNFEELVEKTILYQETS